MLLGIIRSNIMAFYMFGGISFEGPYCLMSDLYDQFMETAHKDRGGETIYSLPPRIMEKWEELCVESELKIQEKEPELSGSGQAVHPPKFNVRIDNLNLTYNRLSMDILGVEGFGAIFEAIGLSCKYYRVGWDPIWCHDHVDAGASDEAPDIRWLYGEACLGDKYSDAFSSRIFDKGEVWNYRDKPYVMRVTDAIKFVKDIRQVDERVLSTFLSEMWYYRMEEFEYEFGPEWYVLLEENGIDLQ